MELQRHLDEIRGRGLGLAAISYDPPETLRAFAEKYGITYPLLSDRGSATIRRWGLLNVEATGPAEGIPHPGTFVIDTQGRIVSRAFESEYQVRQTAPALLAALTPDAPAPARAARTLEGRQLSVTLSQSDVAAAPGTKLSLYADVEPKPKMHVYAPEQTGGYIRIDLRLDENAAVSVAPAVFPTASDYYFAPLDETFKVFDAPFRITQDVTIALTPALRKRAAARETITLTGTLRYQACDDKVCYRPDQIPVTWSIDLQPLVPR